MNSERCFSEIQFVIKGLKNNDRNEEKSSGWH